MINAGGEASLRLILRIGSRSLLYVCPTVQRLQRSPGSPRGSNTGEELWHMDSPRPDCPARAVLGLGLLGDQTGSLDRVNTPVGLAG
jgi:hypothetical protein